MPTLFEYAGGREVLHRLEATFYAKVLADEVLQPLFGAGKPEHVEHLTAFTAESFGGPDDFSRELGFAHLIDVHRGLARTDDELHPLREVPHWTWSGDDDPTDAQPRRASAAASAPRQPPHISASTSATGSTVSMRADTWPVLATLASMSPSK